MEQNTNPTPQSPVTHSGFISIVGKPNAGKSTLVNQLLGQAVAGVSAKPQTTRRRQLVILTTEAYQLILVDTPGLHEPKDKLSQFINSEARYALHDADVIVFLADGSERPDENDAALAELVKEVGGDIPVVLAINKSDVVNPAVLDANRQAFVKLVPARDVLTLSALTGKGITPLLNTLASLVPEGPFYYPEDQVTETFERDIAAEMIRAAAMNELEDEIPYSIATRVDEYSTRENGVIYVKGTIFVERDAQKAIVIGRNGAKIKQIGSAARQEIEKMNGEKVFLDLTVKVRKDWKNDQAFLRELGLTEQG